MLITTNQCIIKDLMHQQNNKRSTCILAILANILLFFLASTLTLASYGKHTQTNTAFLYLRYYCKDWEDMLEELKKLDNEDIALSRLRSPLCSARYKKEDLVLSTGESVVVSVGINWFSLKKVLRSITNITMFSNFINSIGGGFHCTCT